MTITGAAKIAGVIGWPVAHSLSPLLHGAWIEAAQLDAAYVPLPVAPDNIAEALKALPSLGFRGVNVTVPHKAAALESADEASAAAKAIGAANVLIIREDGALFADNTDAIGFMAGLADLDPSLDRPAVIIGAGGAARAAAFALSECGVSEVRIVNRTLSRAEELAEDFGASAVDWARREDAVSDASLIVNATSMGMVGGPPLELNLDAAPSDAVAYDLVYAPLETPFLAAAAEQGLRTIDGLHMLIGQAEPSFEHFFGRPIPRGVDARGLLIQALEARA